MPAIMVFDPAPVRDRALRLALENALRHGGVPRVESVLGGMLGADASLRPHRAEVGAIVREVVDEVAAIPAEGRKARLDELGGPIPVSAARKEAEAQHEKEHGLPPLPGGEEGKVVLRLAPFPSGSLHIGNARGLFVNEEYRRRYHGKFYLVFDDTVGSEEKRPVLESYDLILRDMEAAGIRPDAIYYKSDRLELYYRDVPRLLDLGAAYVCTCPAELLRKNREAGVACGERDREPTWQREQWVGMLGGRYEPGEAVVRVKTDMGHPNPAFRDRVLFRISDFDHPRVGKKYRVWPMLEYAFAIDDVLLGITHVIRGKELIIEDMMEEALWSALGLKGPTFLHWGLLRIRETKISKSKSYKDVKSGAYDGWADPRTWSLSSLARRGIRPEAIRQFILSFGLSQADIEVPAETLYAENRRLLDPTTARRSFVPSPRRLRVEGMPTDLRTARLANHPERPEMGEREVALSDLFFLPETDLLKNAGKEIRLKDLINVQLPPALPASEPGQGGPNAAPEVVARFTDRPNKPLPRIQWVAAPGAVTVDVFTLDDPHLLGKGEAALASAKEGNIFQFERFGFARADPQPPDAAAARRFIFAHP